MQFSHVMITNVKYFADTKTPLA